MKLLIVLVALVLLLVAVWVAAGRMHRFAYWAAPKSDAEVAALATTEWHLNRLQVADDATLVGLIRTAHMTDPPHVLFVPGNSSAVLEGFRDALDVMRGSMAVRMCFWAYRGFDASTGTPSPAALEEDLWRQWQYLQSLGATPANTEVWGYSLGSVLAMRLAARMAANGQSPTRLVLIAAAERIQVMPAGTFGRFLADDVYDATDAIPKIACPTLIVHGTADDALPIEGARRLAAAVGARATLHEIPGKGHLDLWDDVRRLVW